MGSLRSTGRGSELVEIAPEQCPNGHPLRPPNVAVAHMPCHCNGTSGHRTHTCMSCGATVYDPSHST